VALWSSLFGVWSALFYLRTGRFIYPFLGASALRLPRLGTLLTRVVRRTRLWCCCRG
jgi:hypothetical protein